MDRKIIIVIAIVAVLAVLVGVVALSPHQGKEPTSINILTSPTLKNGEAVKFQLTDSKGKAISGQEIIISLTDGKDKNNYTITTDNDGKGSLVLEGMASGNYTVSLTYNGNDKYNASNVVQKLIIGENETTSQSSSNQTVQVEDTHYQENTSSSQSDSSSQKSDSSSDSLTYDSKLNLYYNSEGIVVDPDGGKSMGAGQKYEDMVKQAEEIDKNGLN